jgi:hypothetical protein
VTPERIRKLREKLIELAWRALDTEKTIGIVRSEETAKDLNEIERLAIECTNLGDAD